MRVVALCVVVTIGAVSAVRVNGRIVILEKDNKPSPDLGDAVVYLEGAATPATAAAPDTVEIAITDKVYAPHVVVVPLGSTVRFPNHDPFNHNVFSLSDEAPFDLGLYGRGQSKSTRFTRAGVIRVYCNVHATMAAFILVRDNPYYAQPSGDGTFSMDAVPPGKYRLHAWHERAAEVVRDIEVGATGSSNLDIQLDARGYKFVQHVNKFGQPYSKGGARY